MALPTIVDAARPSVPNFSGIGSSIQSWLSLPDGWQECGPVVEREDKTGGFEVTRNFLGPWSSRAAFRLWAMGASYRVDQGEGVPVGVTRKLPAQDPVYPFLYARQA